MSGVSTGSRLGIAGTATALAIVNPYGGFRGISERIHNRANQIANREKAAKRRPRSAYQAAVNKLTNWERNQWARAGYPGMRAQSEKQVEEFMIARRRERDARKRAAERAAWLADPANEENCCNPDCGCVPPGCAAPNGRKSAMGYDR